MRSRRRPSQEFLLDITVTDDGIRPVREAHSWSRDKLGVLRSYLAAYAKACRRAGSFYFVDAMAGPGRYHIVETDECLMGSTPIALSVQPEFALCLAIERDEPIVGALRQRIAPFEPRAKVVQGDVNEILADAMSDFIPRRSPCFVLLDPEGAELEWETVRKAALHRTGQLKTELLILFATEGVNRMLPVEADIELHNEMRLNRLFPPSSGWREVWLRRRDDEISPRQARELYVDGYCRGLQDLGYRTVLTKPIHQANQGRLIYHLVFATDHEAGEKIMADVFANMNANDPQFRFRM